MMKKYLLVVSCILALLSCDFRRKDKIADDNARITEQAMKDSTTVQIIDSAYDFGTVAEGEKVEFSYRFRNTGTKSLVIITATASCGCTVPHKPERPVLPGETGYIKVVFDSKGRPGQADKYITVTSNARPDFERLQLKGMVQRQQ